MMMRALTNALPAVFLQTIIQPSFVIITHSTVRIAQLINPRSHALELFAVPLMNGLPNVKLPGVHGLNVLPHVAAANKSEGEHCPYLV
jgi:hypothetical protein